MKQILLMMDHGFERALWKEVRESKGDKVRAGNGFCMHMSY